MCVEGVELRHLEARGGRGFMMAAEDSKNCKMGGDRIEVLR